MGGGGSRGQGGHLGDSLELSGWFDESSDDSCGMYVSGRGPKKKLNDK